MHLLVFIRERLPGVAFYKKHFSTIAPVSAIFDQPTIFCRTESIGNIRPNGLIWPNLAKLAGGGVGGEGWFQLILEPQNLDILLSLNQQ